MTNIYFVSKTLTQKEGINAALFFAALLDRHEKAGRPEIFDYLIDEAKTDTGLTRHKQDEAIKSLKNCLLIESGVHGLPARRFFKIDYVTKSNFY